MSLKKVCDDATDIIVSCWDSNQECDENGKPLDGLTFDERLNKKMKELSNDSGVKEVIEDAVDWCDEL